VRLGSVGFTIQVGRVRDFMFTHSKFGESAKTPTRIASSDCNKKQIFFFCFFSLRDSFYISCPRPETLTVWRFDDIFSRMARSRYTCIFVHFMYHTVFVLEDFNFFTPVLLFLCHGTAHEEALLFRR